MKFYLIDDNSESVHKIVNTVCCKLWKRMDNLDLTVVLLGDDYKENPMAQDATDEDVSIIQDAIQQRFHELCFAIDRHEWDPLGTAYRRKKETTKIECKHVSLQDSETKKQLDAWRAVKKSENDGEETNCSILQESALPKKLAEWIGIQDKAVIALDICLLYDDYARCIQKLPVLSHALHHYLEAECGCVCFLYSRMSVNTAAKGNWMDLYKEQFATDTPPEIHSLFNLYTNDSVEYQELERLLTEKTDSQKGSHTNES